MKKIYRKSGRKYLLDTEQDLIIYDGAKARGLDITWGRPVRWLSLHARRVLNDAPIFYIAHYTTWPGEMNFIQEISESEATIFVEDALDVMSKEGLKLAYELGILNTRDIL